MQRRGYLKAMAAGCVALVSGCATRPAAGGGLEELNTLEAARAIRDGEITAEQYAGALLARCEAARHLNAFTHLDPQAVLAAARAVDKARTRGEGLPPLAGVPLVVKENIDIAGLPTTGATPGLRDNVPARTAVAVQRLLDAGALILAKTNMGELALSGTSSESIYGPVRNPYDPSRFAGGSSGGTAAAIAARAVPAGLGTDVAGSGRIPAAFCGVVGFRPGTNTIKPYPTHGVLPLASALGTIAPMGRTVADVALLDAVLRGRPARNVPGTPAARVRLAISPAYFGDDAEPEVERVMAAALEKLREAGVTLVEVDLGDLPARAAALQGRIMMAGMKGDDLRAYLQAANSALQPEDVLAQIQAPAIANLFRKAARMPWPPGAQQAAYAEAQVLARRFEETLARAGAAALVFACEPVTAQKIKDPIDASPWIVNGNRITPQTLIRNSSVAAGLGLPAIAVPVGISSNGLPVGLELNTPTGQDLAALSLAGMVESIIGREPPPPSAA